MVIRRLAVKKVKSRKRNKVLSSKTNVAENADTTETSKSLFGSITKKLVFFRDILKIFWRYLIFLG